jgi:hypothetical protein
MCLTVLWTYSHLKRIKVKKTSVRKTYLIFLKLLTCLLTLLLHLADNTEDQKDLLCRFKNCGFHKNVKSDVSLKNKHFILVDEIKFHTHRSDKGTVKIMQYKVEREFRKNFFLEPEVARLYIESAFVNSSNNQKLKCSIDSTKHKSTKCGKIVLSLRAPKSWHHFVSKAKLEEHVKIQQHHFVSLSFSILIFCFFLH